VINYNYIINYIAVSCLAHKQWAAERIYLSPITLAPQPLAQSMVGLKSNTKLHCHGHEYLRASVPPTIRNETSGSILGMPQPPASTSTESVIQSHVQLLLGEVPINNKIFLFNRLLNNQLMNPDSYELPRWEKHVSGQLFVLRPMSITQNKRSEVMVAMKR